MEQYIHIIIITILHYVCWIVMLRKLHFRRLHSYVYNNYMFIKVIQNLIVIYIYPYKPNKFAQLEVYQKMINYK